MSPAPHQSTVYHRLARIYDGCLSPFFGKRAQKTIRALEIPTGARVLEVGVGTGASLDAYPVHVHVVGIDLSDEMLEHAREKIRRHGWRHVEVKQMDALNLEFPDDSFDYVMAFHIATVVPDHRPLMREIARVCRPGGRIVVINHLRSPRRWLAGLVDLLGPLTRQLGWHTKLSYEDLVSAAPIRVIRRYKTSPRSLFTVVIAEKPASAVSAVS
jgi:phosphatidylethanolamine/phosphatidyl-N-methylethanolamine N-methyltransferase